MKKMLELLELKKSQGIKLLGTGLLFFLSYFLGAGVAVSVASPSASLSNSTSTTSMFSSEPIPIYSAHGTYDSPNPTSNQTQISALTDVHTSSSSSLPVSSSSENNWGLGFSKPNQKPTGNATSEDLRAYQATFMDSTDEPIIYLTFDCGYENGNTPLILDALKKHNAPATFFVVGNYLETSPDLIRRMVDEGHTVANHTYHHPNMSQISTVEAFQKELQEVETLYQEITGSPMVSYYRPPQGKYSTANLQMAKDLGYTTFFWSLAYVDWIQEKQPSKEEAFDKLLNRIHPGAIVLLHNTSSTNGAIMDELLTKWEEMGYRFAPLSDLANTLQSQ